MNRVAFVSVLMSVVFGVGLNSASFAGDGGLPTSFSKASEYVIDYEDLNFILQSAVLDVGPSDRHPAARKAFRNTQTKIRHGNYRPSAFEANRVSFNKFKQIHRDTLLAIRQDLEAVNDQVPLEKFTKNEQLAYWLNLHNVAVMLEIANAYPLKKIKKLKIGARSVWDEKTMSIGGVPISIQDIENHVISNWDNPVVLYGFFMGTIGGPNIRKNAFTGANVYKSLQLNARRFVNSLRGFRIWSGTGRASEHYELGARYFPNFSDDVKQHLEKYANDATRRLIEKSELIKANNYDWGIADMANGSPYTGGSFNTSPASLGFFITTPTNAGVTAGASIDSIFFSGAFSGRNNGKVSPQIRALVQGIREREQRRVGEGSVAVEEFIKEKTTPATTKDEKKAPQKNGEDNKDGNSILVTF